MNKNIIWIALIAGILTTGGVWLKNYMNPAMSSKSIAEVHEGATAAGLSAMLQEDHLYGHGLDKRYDVLIWDGKIYKMPPDTNYAQIKGLDSLVTAHIVTWRRIIKTKQDMNMSQLSDTLALIFGKEKIQIAMIRIDTAQVESVSLQGYNPSTPSIKAKAGLPHGFTHKILGISTTKNSKNTLKLYMTGLQGITFEVIDLKIKSGGNIYVGEK